MERHKERDRERARERETERERERETEKERESESESGREWESAVLFRVSCAKRRFIELVASFHTSPGYPRGMRKAESDRCAAQDRSDLPETRAPSMDPKYWDP